MRTLILVAAVVAGCSHAAPPPTTPPPPPKPEPVVATCEQVAEHAHALLQPKYGEDKDKHDRLTAVILTRCTTDKWSTESKACVMNTQSLENGQHCMESMTPAQHEALMTGMDAEVKKSSSKLPQSCLDYKASMDAYIACDKLPQAARDTMRDAFKQSWDAFTQMPDNQEAHDALDTACKAATDGMKQSLQAMGC